MDLPRQVYRQRSGILDPGWPRAARRGPPARDEGSRSPVPRPVGRVAPYRLARKEAAVLERPPSAVAVTATVSRRVALKGFTTRLPLLESLTYVLV
jgi:hypothetical protein